jgi:hypothetical protein
MKGFVLGVLVAGMAVAGYLYWTDRMHPPAKPTLSADGGVPTKDAREKKKKRHRGAVSVAHNDGAGATAAAAPAEPEPVKLSPADLKLVAQGDDLSRPDVIHMGDATDDSGSHELSQDDIDAKFHPKEEAILGCISKARPDEDTYVPGRVTVKFRIQRTGNVRGVRVEAPAILQKGGVYSCIKGVVGGIRFPPSNSSQVVSYPFSLT